MKTYYLAVGLAALFATAFCGCSDNDDPQLPPEPDKPEVSGVGLSKTFTQISFDDRFAPDADTIYFETDDWMLSRVLFSKSYKTYFNEYDKAFVAEFMGNEPFSTDCGWMHLDYADRRLIITAIESYDESDEYDIEAVYENPHRRYARLLFDHEAGTDTMVCAQVADMLLGVDYSSEYTPSELIVAKSGVSITYSNISYFAPLAITIDGVTHTLNTVEEIEASPSNDFSFKQDWVECKYYSTKGADEDGNVKYDQMVLTISPNETGQSRSFSIGFKYADPAMLRYAGISGTQLAE